MIQLQKNLNALLILILSGVLLSGFGVQFIHHEEPCPLCMLQRIAMIGSASGAALNLFFSVRMSHYSLILISSICGGFISLRQISLHVCPGFSTFGFPVLGLSLYTWAFIVFVSTIAYVSILLCLYDPSQKEEATCSLNGVSKFACILILCITFANVITTFLQCGLGPCVD
jgi:disulfide bond formation protein DsbB